MKIGKARRLITDVDRALDKALGANAPELIIKKGTVRCPWCGKKVAPDGIINLDCSIRWNRGEFTDDADGGHIVFNDGDKQFDTFGCMTECCMALVAIPEGVDETWV